jgi:3-phenylpropionate/cinnamic acid dioxygenase small subunit
MSAIGRDLLSAIDELQIRYISALDRRDLEAWLACFAPEASYICTPRENEEQGLPLALMMDDCYERLRDRVSYITQVWAGTFEDYWTRHFIQRLACAPAEPEGYTVLTNFSVVYTTDSGRSEILVAGCYDDRVIVGPDGARFRAKKAVLDTSITPRYLVYPV